MSLSVENISVSFPGVKALANVSIEFKDKRIHALLGANGSGKSTLVKVLTGIYHPDKGTDAKIHIAESMVENIETPTIAHDMGVRVVHQESPLLNTFTIAECIALFKGYPKIHGMIDWKAVKQYCIELFEVFEIQVNPDTYVEDLSASDRNMIAMAMAIGKDEELENTRGLILDEADASIPESEAEAFLTHVRRVADMGIPVIMVTHRMKEVAAYCDDISILNGGQLVYSGLVSETSEDFIVSKMMRVENKKSDDAHEATAAEHTLKELWDLLDKKVSEADEKPVLEVKDLYAKNINGLSFSVRPGEILGIVGVPGCGINELPIVLGGDMKRKSGTFLVDGEEMPVRLSPRMMYQKGVNVLPCDRPVRGGIMSLSLRDNVLMPNEKQFWNKGKLAKKSMEMAVDVFDVQPDNNINMQFGKFSGGNQQKAILAKWLMVCPKVLILDDPTYGVDPGSRLRIFDAMQKAAEMNVALIVFSTEPEQLVNVCSRVIAMRDGKEVSELKAEDSTLTRENIVRWCYM